MVSIKNIASACGVSIATVSKALNNHNDVSKETKEKIEKAAKQLGYMPNSQARALKTNKTFNIGVLFIDQAHSGLTHNYFASVLNSFKVQVEKMGYDITFISNNLGNRHMTYYEHCKYRNVDGVIIACVDFNDESVQELINSDIPVVTIDYLTDNKLSVLSDNKSGMSDLIEYIYSMGHRNIAYIYGEESLVSDERIMAYKSTLNKYGIEINEENMIQGAYHDPEYTEKITLKLLEQKNPPSCILAPDDFSALGTINAVKSKGLSVPKDISIAGYDGIYILQALEPRITTMKQNTNEIGKMAAKQLIKAIKKEIPENAEPIIIKGELCKGETVRLFK